MTEEVTIISLSYTAEVLASAFVCEGYDVYPAGSIVRVGTLIEDKGDTLVVRFNDNQPEPHEAIHEFVRTWDGDYSERERGLIQNCESYATREPSGLPGHQLMLLVAKMAADLDQIEQEYIG